MLSLSSLVVLAAMVPQPYAEPAVNTSSYPLSKLKLMRELDTRFSKDEVSKPVQSPGKKADEKDPHILDIYRDFKVGDRDTFEVDADIQLIGAASLHWKGTITQQVTKIDKIEADLNQFTKSVISCPVSGEHKEAKEHGGKIKLTRYGVIRQAEVIRGDEIPIAEMMQLALLTPMNGIKPGFSVKFDSRSTEDSRSFIKGQVYCESHIGTTVRMISEITYQTPETPIPVHVSTKTDWNYAAHKPVKIEMWVRKLPKKAGKPEIESIHLKAHLMPSRH